MEKKYKVKLNSIEKVEELLQEVYDQSCRQINEIQNEISKLITSCNLGKDDVTMDDKAKYFKAMHDMTTDKTKAIALKLDITKFMGELIKKSGDLASVVNDKNYTKKTSLNLDQIRDAINDGDDVDTYNLK